MSVPVPTVDLRPDHWDIVRSALRRHVPDREVLAFGSRATWTAKDYSDLDLAVMGEEPLSLRTAAALDEALGDSDLPFKVDVVDWARIDEGFRRIILRNGVSVQARPKNPKATRPGVDPLTTGAQAMEQPSQLGIYAEIVMGQSPPGNTTNTSGDGVPLLNGPTEFGLHHPSPSQFTTDPRKMANPGDLLFCVRGSTTGRMNWADQEYAIGRGVAALRHKHGHQLQPFVRGVVEFSLPELLSQATGSTFPNVSARQLATVWWPPIKLAQQRAIAHVLGTLDHKMELNRRMNQTLEAMARALFKSWFVDFDPVRAKMEGRDTGLPRDIADLFPNRLVDSEMGEVPEGWEVSEIGKEVHAVGGSTPSTKEPSYWHDGQRYWATPKDLSKLWSPVLLETSRKITDGGLQKISSGTLPLGTVLMSSRAPIGYLAIAEIPTAVNQGFIAMRCERRLPNLYVLYWCERNLGYIRDIAGGSTFAEISKKTFRTVPVIVPSEAILAMYQRLSRPLYDLLVTKVKEAATVAALRDTLLPKLISGEIRVLDVEQAVESVP